MVINCAALTDVDGCEERKQEAFEINGHAVGRLGRLAERQGAVLLHVSTDYVFPGDGDRPYREDDPTGPASVYGESKLLGELELADCWRALVVRTSWLFGPGGRNFVDTIAQRAVTGAPLRVVDDQLGAPTYAPFLARALADLAEVALRGGLDLPRRLHYRNREPTTWYGFASAVVSTWRAEC